MAGYNAPDPNPPPEGGINADRDVQAGRDIAGRDIHHTQVGLGERTVLRLILIVGLLVFFATACSFTAGAVAMAGAISALQQPVLFSPQAADDMETKLQQLAALPPGAPFEVVLSETELNSYFHFRVAEGMGLDNGQARLLGDDQLAVSGSLEAMGGRNVIAVFDVQEGDERPLNLSSASVQMFETGTSLGWAAVPTLVLQGLEDQANNALGGSFLIQNLELINVDRPDAPGGEPGWLLNGVSTQ